MIFTVSAARQNQIRVIPLIRINTWAPDGAIDVLSLSTKKCELRKKSWLGSRTRLTRRIFIKILINVRHSRDRSWCRHYPWYLRACVLCDNRARRAREQLWNTSHHTLYSLTAMTLRARLHCKVTDCVCVMIYDVWYRIVGRIHLKSPFIISSRPFRHLISMMHTLALQSVGQWNLLYIT